MSAATIEPPEGQGRASLEEQDAMVEELRALMAETAPEFFVDHDYLVVPSQGVMIDVNEIDAITPEPMTGYADILLHNGAVVEVRIDAIVVVQSVMKYHTTK